MNLLRPLRLLGFQLIVLVGCNGAAVVPPDGTADGPDVVSIDASLTDAETVDDGSAPDASDASLPPDAAVAACVGTTFACWGRDAEGCALGIGCTSGFTCFGSPLSCPTQVTREDCTAILGCAWNAMSGRCTGGQTPCAAFDDALSCDAQPGCVFAHICSGRSTSCGELDAARCVMQLGCSLPTASVGAADSREQ